VNILPQPTRASKSLRSGWHSAPCCGTQPQDGASTLLGILDVLLVWGSTDVMSVRAA